MAAIESLGAYPESPMDPEDVVYPCKGCGEILEEGKAFELAGNRWHIDCFRCNTCGTLLDSDANLLLLGDGSLICNNCTYSCNACGNKIEDLAILTGDQAFCSGCFRCRSCKRKIENLRYARTSQGIFCMACHESLMARRRKKARTPKTSSGNHIEKALPSLPPGAVPTSAFTPDIDTPDESYSESHTPQPKSPRERLRSSRNGATSGQYQRDISPLADDVRRGGPTLPASTYNDHRPSDFSAEDDDGEERGFLPMAFDPTPVSGPPPGSIPRKQLPRSADPSPPVQKENLAPRDYFGGGSRTSNRTTARDFLREDHRPGSSRSVSTDRETERVSGQPKASPHIFSQDKGRNRRAGASGGSTPMANSMSTSPVVASAQDRNQQRPKPQTTESYNLAQQEGFKLQEVPKSRKRTSSKANTISPDDTSPVEFDGKQQADQTERPASPVSLDSNSDVNPFDDPKRKEAAHSTPAPVPAKHADRSLPLRGDSLNSAGLKSRQAAQDSPSPRNTAMIPPSSSGHGRHASASSVPSSADAQSSLSRDVSRSQATDSPAVRSSFDAIPPRAPGRPSAPSKSVANDDFIAPRVPPPPPAATSLDKQKQHESISTMQSDRSESQLSPSLGSAGLLKYNGDGAFSMDDEMGRIMRGDTTDKSADISSSPSVLRRVSNAVKHGRSFSDREVGRTARSHGSGSIDISAPIEAGDPRITAPTSTDSVEQLRVALRRAQQRNAELEAEKLALQEKLNHGSSDMKAINTELNKKRDTMTELDRQREVLMRELVIMTENLKKSKDSNQPFDLGSLQAVVLREFAESLQDLKDSLSPQIDDLMRKRNELTDEIANLIQMKDKGFQEYDSLSAKNAQLMQHNNELLRNIKNTYQENRGPGQASAGANGLGIYHTGARVDTSGLPERNASLPHTESSMSNLLQESEAQPATILEGPQVINIRKGIKPTKFNWRKGGEKMAKNVTKGLKGAFAGSDRYPGAREDGQYSIGVPYNQTQPGGPNDPNGMNGRRDVDGKSFGFFSQKNGNLKAGNGLGHMKSNSSNNLVASDGSTLFGTELTLRCEYENRLIPSIVTRCIQEVEARGMDVEGVYRKSGGAGQVKYVQQGFEKDTDFDTSDPDLDIHSITSTLKQYFRKLPTPLIVYDAYDLLLDAGQIQNDKEKQVAALRAALQELPDAHRDCLQYLVQHLARVMSHEPVNLMTPLNLAVVFAPTIMRPTSIEREMTDMQVQRVALQALLEHHKVVFPAED